MHIADTSPYADIIDLRDVIARFEELEAERETWVSEEARPVEEWDDSDDGIDFRCFTDLLDNLKGYGGDEQWRGDWYPITLIADHHFQDHAEELAEDLCGDDMRSSTWPMNCINWEEAAKQLQVDYSTVEYGGNTFWYR